MFGVWKTGQLDPDTIKLENLFTVNDTIRYITRNYSSIYQLLPSSDYFNYGLTSYYEECVDTNDDRKIQGQIFDYSGMKEWFYGRDASPRYNDVNIAMLDKAEVFHAALDKMIITDNSIVEGYMIASDRQATPIQLRDYIGTNGQVRHSQIFYVNDGTHGGLLNLEPVIQKTINILNGDLNMPVYGIRNGDPSKLNGYYVYAACPVDLYVTDSEGQVADPETWGTSMINYWITGETKHAFVHDYNFDMELKGTGHGVADLVIERYENGEKTERYSYFGIPTEA